MTKQSKPLNIFGDLDRMTVKELRELLAQYSDDARIEARTTEDDECYVVISEE